LRRVLQLGVPTTVLVVLALVPKLSLDIPVVFNGPLSSPGTLQLLALCLLFAGIALTYDVLFGFTGLLSFGHALFVAAGVYVFAIALTRWEWNLWQTLGMVVLVAVLLPLVLGAVSLRVGGIAFAMVTLAFAQAGQVLVQKNPYGWTGGEEGTGLNYDHIPDAFVGVLNTKNLYWLALAYAVLVFVVVRLAVNSSAGHVWRAVRENEPRVPVLGLNPYPFKVIAFVVGAVACFLFMMSGVEMVLAAFRPWAPSVVVDTVASFSFITHFGRLMKGVIDLSTLLFFGSLIGVCLLVNTLLVDLKKAA